MADDENFNLPSGVDPQIACNYISSQEIFDNPGQVTEEQFDELWNNEDDSILTNVDEDRREEVKYQYWIHQTTYLSGVRNQLVDIIRRKGFKKNTRIDIQEISTDYFIKELDIEKIVDLMGYSSPQLRLVQVFELDTNKFMADPDEDIKYTTKIGPKLSFRKMFALVEFQRQIIEQEINQIKSMFDITEQQRLADLITQISKLN